ncbi:hypothetical protein EXIGLDRAFT_128695 [Exidia glandulosa HHB12029]|uniref:Uncharacterized protein n=1 Tax=Exidia glandulosa HHB12029 TaxID=1314781 RepID=A0A165G834_EXIGL|nr:hypothetical protein EXIGLDRAFT_128695 [Exidia glandulosa HHB12029]
MWPRSHLTKLPNKLALILPREQLWQTQQRCSAPLQETPRTRVTHTLGCACPGDDKRARGVLQTCNRLLLAASYVTKAAAGHSGSYNQGVPRGRLYVLKPTPWCGNPKRKSESRIRQTQTRHVCRRRPQHNSLASAHVVNDSKAEHSAERGQ